MQAFTKTISEAHIILTTTVSSVTINKKINDPDFRFIPNAVILDEAAQASWSDTLCFLTYGANRLVLVGDENQLDPTVISQEKVLK
jgi:superfamily I DNA and/or RNA helicase